MTTEPTTEQPLENTADALERMLIQEKKVLLNNYEVMKISKGDSTIIRLEYSPIKKIDEKKLFRLF